MILCHAIGCTSQALPRKLYCAEHLPVDTEGLIGEIEDYLATAGEPWFCEHGFYLGLACLDCDVPSYLPAVLPTDESQEGRNGA